MIAKRPGARKNPKTTVAFAGVAALSVLLAGCGETVQSASVKSTKEYFAESEYGVKASPRVAYGASELPRGGGRYQVGKPYQIKGRWYRPKEDPDYVAEGKASWYGDAFHGRLTANGEVYDMTHLSAAHPTMPLPSYARVTNVNNGSSVVVRVNDRGPFAKDRVIDLSKRAAELLDYKHAGVARVRVEYVGPAPLNGRDDEYLMASYQPGGMPDPSDGLPTGVMVAMAGPTPTQPVPSAAVAFASQPDLTESAATVALPQVGPLVPDRPDVIPTIIQTAEIAALSYADQRVSAASRVFDAVVDPGLDAQAVQDWWAGRSASAGQPAEGSFVNLGAWTSREDAERIMHSLSGLGRLVIEPARSPDGQVFVLSLVPDGHAGLDEVLQAAWAAGATDAFAVRD
ncbi:septal ring lytic transglycosylase RlpA family protein [Chelativorans sp. AA-79]|uniref:septal ring lytic transglycosylase RlpA family protein n=1 Tax=Chelativorans sp. AA-79 TaxID=3028735 RepID=UPI0023F75DAE|nr:septal ring lytic transglycosylase RlpA family protein [Chelativorans sp. AA-79]WEX07189.1 septal ring lytic transglycosylase RlpA family protein [Chelativorans sp. AA-79]